MELLYTAIAWFFGGIVTGISGMGASLVTVPMMTLFLDIHFVIIISNVMLIYICVIIIWKYKEYSDLKFLNPLFISCIPGIIAGTLILYFISAAYLQMLMAAFLFTYIGWNLFKKGKPTKKTPQEIKRVMIICGFFAGLFGSSISLPGPILAIFCLYGRLSTKQSLVVICEGAMMIAIFICISYGFAGLFETSMIPYILTMIPAATIGIYAASPFLKYVTDEKFKIVILTIVSISSIITLFRALDELGIY